MDTVGNKKCLLFPRIRKKEVAFLKVLHKVVYVCGRVGGDSVFEREMVTVWQKYKKKLMTIVRNLAWICNRKSLAGFENERYKIW